MPAMQYESEYCIDVVNRFAGLDFEDDPLELIQQAQQKGKTLKAEKKQKGGKQSAKPQEKVQTFTTKETVVEDVKKEGPKGDKPERQDRGEQRGRGRGGRGRGRGRGRGAGGDRPPREGRGDFGDRKEGNDQQDDGEHKPFGGERRGGFGGERRGGFGGERRGYGGERRGGFGGERRGFGDRQGFGGDRQADRQGFGDKQGFGERKGFGNDSESSGERKGFGGGFGEQGDQQEDGFGRRGGRGFSRPRGRGRGRGGRGREFDRHSGSDRSYPSSSVKATEKREGSGAFNWGTPQDELEASEEANGVTQMDDEVKGSWADAAEQSEQQETIEGAGEGDPSIPKEEEAKEMTLDEYKSMMEKEKLQTTYRVRQANEGEKSFPKNAVTVRKLTEDEQEQDGSLYFPKRIIEEKIKTSGREKNFLQFDLKYAAMDSRLTSGNTGGRGNRRGGRGGRVGRGGSRRGGREGSDRHEERMSGGFGEKEPAVVEHYDEDFPNLQ